MNQGIHLLTPGFSQTTKIDIDSLRNTVSITIRAPDVALRQHSTIKYGDAGFTIKCMQRGTPLMLALLCGDELKQFNCRKPVKLPVKQELE